MRRISSQKTVYFKKVFPKIWFGFLGFFVIVLGYIGFGKGIEIPIVVMIHPFIMAIVGYFIMKALCLDLADEVYDCGNHLLVKKDEKEARILLSNIRNISHSTLVTPPRIELSLREPSIFGNEIVFSPISSAIPNPFKKSPIVDELLNRIDTERKS